MSRTRLIGVGLVFAKQFSSRPRLLIDYSSITSWLLLNYSLITPRLLNPWLHLDYSFVTNYSLMTEFITSCSLLFDYSSVYHVFHLNESRICHTHKMVLKIFWANDGARDKAVEILSSTFYITTMSVDVVWIYHRDVKLLLCAIC